MDKLANKTIEMLDEQIEKLIKKGDISQTEVDALKDAWTIKMMLECYDEQGAMSYAMMPDPEMGSYGSYGGSYRRGRSTTTGRYMSRESGYSSHSIKDRMIARLEAMYDEAKSEHEREEIQKEIRRIESEK